MDLRAELEKLAAEWGARAAALWKKAEAREEEGSDDAAEILEGRASEVEECERRLKALLAAHPEPDTAYRPGLPTVEQVRAHQAREPLGTWQIRYPGKPEKWPEFRQFFAIEAVGMPAGIFGVMPIGDSGDGVVCRPCTADGTPVCWRTLETT